MHQFNADDDDDDDDHHHHRRRRRRCLHCYTLLFTRIRLLNEIVQTEKNRCILIGIIE